MILIPPLDKAAFNESKGILLHCKQFAPFIAAVAFQGASNFLVGLGVAAQVVVRIIVGGIP